MLQRGVYTYKYIDIWHRFNETSLPDKKQFYSNLKIEDITDSDFKHTKKVWKDFQLKNPDHYHDLYMQSDTLVLEDIFENICDKCFETYEDDPAHFLSAPGLAWQSCLKDTKIELELLTNIYMLQMLEKRIRSGIRHAIYQYAKADNKFMKDFNKNKESSYLTYWDACYLRGWTLFQKLTVDYYEWRMRVFDESFKKIMMKIVIKNVLEVDVK